MVLKLGTRKSLLAWSQSQWVAKQLETLNPGLQVQLVGMETQGDKIQDKPLSQIEGKEFFTAELDQALLRGDTHLTVHSMKDLSLDRPPQFTMAAVPERELPHDVILFHESVVDRLKQGLPIRIGTSSPRRLTLVPEFLKHALPRLASGGPILQFVEIRGNVNTRLSRVHEAEGTPRKLDGVVLAFAGLERLSLNPEAVAELDRLRKNTRMMLVPAQSFPTAPAQGALAVECRSDQPEVQAAIRKLHHPATETAIREERKILSEWGGGCHQKLGATFLEGTLHIAGEMPDGKKVQEKRSAKSSSVYSTVEASEAFNFKALPVDAATASRLHGATHLFFAHSRAFDYLSSESKQAILKNRLDRHVWVSGWKSWKKLAEAGVWVEGCAEGQAYASTMALLRQKYLLALSAAHFAFVSHPESGDNPYSDLIATYQHEFREIPEKVAASEQLYWSSGLLFESIWSKIDGTPEAAKFKAKKHFCGPGKTADRIRKLGFEPIIVRGDA